MTDAVVATRARSFDAWAHEYDRYRPSYPPALFDEISMRLRLPQAPRVVDLGAGTGLATLAMARLGWRVTAVEPGGPMLAVLRQHATAEGLDVATVEASAEATGQPDASADLATAAQAFHWFDPERAVTEMARVVRPGGGIALFWNVRDDNASPFLAAYSQVLTRSGIRPDESRAGRRPQTGQQISHSRSFEASDFFQVHHVRPMTPDEFIGLVFTASYVRTRSAETQARIREAVTALLREHAPDGTLDVPYIVDCEIARRLPA